MQTLLTELDHGLSKSLRHSIDKNQGKIYIFICSSISKVFISLNN